MSFEKELSKWLDKIEILTEEQYIDLIEIINKYKLSKEKVSEVIRKLKRYNLESDGACGDPDCCGEGTYDMEESEEGEYVKFKDLKKEWGIKDEEER